MRVVVLGCGPAGLMAAHAAVGKGAEVMILSRRVKSPLHGAQYLHAPIPGMTPHGEYAQIEYQMRGTPEEYRRKVYGKQWDGTVSPEDLSEVHFAWDIRTTYDRLWDAYSDLIEDTEIIPGVVMAAQSRLNPDLIVNSIPLPALCTDNHFFASQEITAAGGAPTLGIDIGKQFHCTPDTVICNGLESPSWYRISNIFGHTTVEWPAGIAVPIPSASVVNKPTRHNCDCWKDMLHVGRFGSWRKGVLSHSAYFATLERIINGPTAQASEGAGRTLPSLY